MAKKNKKKAIWAVIILIVIIVSSILLIIIQVPYTANVIYTEKEPYTDKDCQDINLKSVVEFGNTNNVCLNEICDSHESRCAEKNFWGNCIRYYDVCTHYACTKYKYQCNLNIENIDDVAGTWSVSAYSLNRDNGQSTFVDTVSVFIQPQRTGIATWEFVADAGENVICQYQGIRDPTKTDCENIISYKNVEKTKIETRYCNAWKKLAGKCEEITVRLTA